MDNNDRHADYARVMLAPVHCCSLHSQAGPKQQLLVHLHLACVALPAFICCCPTSHPSSVSYRLKRHGSVVQQVSASSDLGACIQLMHIQVGAMAGM